MDNFEIVQVQREGIAPGARPLPLNTTAVVLPVSQGQIGKDADAKAEVQKVTSLEEAFKKFQPRIEVKADIDGFDYGIEADIRNMRGFTPEALEERQEGKRNDLANLKDTVSLLTRLKERWDKPQVRAMWQDPSKREAIIQAFDLLKDGMSSIAGPEKS